MEKYAAKIADIVKRLFAEDVEIELSRPDSQFGDISTNIALKIGQKLGQNPRQIAMEIVEALTSDTDILEASVAGPGFINLRISDQSLWQLATSRPNLKTDQTIVIETNNPNPFKAMHIGHALNSITADAIANLLEITTDRLHRVSYHGDVGLHVGKSMYAILDYTKNQPERLLEVSGDERNSFMSRMYALGSKAYKENESAKNHINELAKQSFDRKDPVYLAIYDTIFSWSFEEINAAVGRLGNKPVEKRFLESESDQRGVKIVRDNTPTVFQESDGALIFKGSEHGSFDNAFVSSSGLGLYAARDLGLIELKNEAFHPDRSYIVTAEEQRGYFLGVLSAADMIWPDHSGQTINISTGTLKLTTGKMSSRDGEVIEIAWLFDQIADAIKARGGETTEDIVAGALRYAFLKVRVGSDIVFDINEAVSIQGNSGPYLQYAHARASSILAKSGSNSADHSKPTNLEEGERNLLRKLSEYSGVVKKSTNELMPHHICTYLYELCQEFNRFYEHNKVIGSERETERLALVGQYKTTLGDGLALLGISAPEKM